MVIFQFSVTVSSFTNIMRKVLYILSFLLLLSSCKTKKEDTSTYNYLPQNEQQSVVYDLSNLFSTKEKDSLTKRILNYEKVTTNQIAIATFDSIPKNTTTLRYATDIANYWGVGTKETNNGLLILISRYDREMSIATGLGTEKILTDLICSKIIDRTIIPHFKQDKYYNGVNSGLDSIIAKWK